MEIEVKFKFSGNKETLKNKFLTEGFKKQKESHQEDIYYLSGKVVDGKELYLRTREDFLKDTFSFDFHEVISNLATKETEVNISNKESLEKINYIIENLGFQKLVSVNKKREVLKNNEVSLVFDQVKDLGDFIEIEVEGEETEDVISILKHYQDLCNLKDEDKIEGKGYPDLLLENI